MRNTIETLAWVGLLIGVIIGAGALWSMNFNECRKFGHSWFYCISGDR